MGISTPCLPDHLLRWTSLPLLLLYYSLFYHGHHCLVWLNEPVFGAPPCIGTPIHCIDCSSSSNFTIPCASYFGTRSYSPTTNRRTEGNGKQWFCRYLHCRVTQPVVSLSKWRIRSLHLIQNCVLLSACCFWARGTCSRQMRSVLSPLWVSCVDSISDKIRSLSQDICPHLLDHPTS